MNNPLYAYYTYAVIALSLTFIFILIFNDKFLNKFDSRISSFKSNHANIILLLIVISFGYQLHALWKGIILGH